MEKYHNTLQASNGDIITTATVTVYLQNSGTLASLKEDDESTALNNPFTVSDSNYATDGSFFFKVINGVYDIKVVNGSDTTWLYDVSVFDSADAGLGLGIVDNATSTAMTIDSSEDISYVGTAQYAAGEGIVFNGDAIAAANTFDDYEEGNWTPVLSDGTNNATMGSQSGTYTKSGDRVIAECHCEISSLGSVSGALRVTGFPFTANGSNPKCGGVGTGGFALNISAGVNVTVRVPVAAAYGDILLWDSGAGSTSMIATEWSSNGGVDFVFNFRV